MPLQIVYLDRTTPERAALMQAHVPPGMVLTCATEDCEAHRMALIAQADYAITGQVAVTRELMRAGTRLKLVHKSGVGLDNIDLVAAHELGIRVARTTGSNAVPVAEFALGAALAALRGIAHGNAVLKTGDWRGVAGLPGPSYLLSNKVVGILGFGAIGQAFARLLGGFGCTILYTQRNPLPPEQEEALNARYAPLDTLLSIADLVSLHCPLTDSTRGMIDAAALAKMKPSAVLVNTARGGIVVEADLVAALQAGRIAGAAVDVFAQEPLPADSPLLGRIDRLVVTPHIAAVAADTFVPTLQRIFRNIGAVEAGAPLTPGDLVVG